MGFEIKPVAEAGSDITRHKNKFIEKFGSTPSFYIRVPGRVNIIGERKIIFFHFYFAYVAKELIFKLYLLSFFRY